MIDDHPVVAFARDFSNDEASIVERVRGFVAEPPSDLPTVGFYGSRNLPARARMFMAAVTLLRNEGRIVAVEDKYGQDVLRHWRETGVIDSDTMPATARAVFLPLIEEDVFEDGWDDEEAAAYRDVAWNGYGQATLELERHIAARGRALLSVDATDGDTMHFALVPPAVAERWRDVALAEHDGYVAGVRAPMWDRYWRHLTYALDGLDEGRNGYPPGTRLRAEALAVPAAQ